MFHEPENLSLLLNLYCIITVTLGSGYNQVISSKLSITILGDNFLNLENKAQGKSRFFGRSKNKNNIDLLLVILQIP